FQSCTLLHSVETLANMESAQPKSKHAGRRPSHGQKTEVRNQKSEVRISKLRTSNRVTDTCQHQASSVSPSAVRRRLEPPGARPPAAVRLATDGFQAFPWNRPSIALA